MLGEADGNALVDGLALTLKEPDTEAEGLGVKPSETEGLGEGLPELLAEGDNETEGDTLLEPLND